MERRQTPEADNKPSPDFVYNIANTCCHPIDLLQCDYEESPTAGYACKSCL